MDKRSVVHTDDLLQRLAAADGEAFRQIYDRYWKTVYQAALRYLRSPDLADDVVQEIFCALWDRREHFVHVEKLENYLVSMAHHHIYGLFRKWAAETRNRKEYTETLELSVDDADFPVRSRQYEDILDQLVDRLPPQQKQIFRMAREEGMTHEAIAKELNLSQGTVKNHMVRALQFLRRNLSPHVGLYLLILYEWGAKS